MTNSDPTCVVNLILVVRQHRKRIMGTKDGNGNWVTEPNAIEKIISDYYRDIFSSSCPSTKSIDAVLEYMDERVDDDMRALMNDDFTREDIRQAAFQMEEAKALGPDGMTPTFFHQCWHIVDEDITSMSLAFLNEGDKEGVIRGVSVARSVPRVSNFFFADDSILFLRAGLFDCSESFIHELNMVIANFWWGSTDSKRQIHWKSWESLCISKSDNTLNWNGSSLGIFSIRSVYYMAHRILGCEVQQEEGMRRFWKIVCNSNVMPKVKYFIWRLVRDILPIKLVLQCRGLTIEDICDVCGDQDLAFMFSSTAILVR
ncbi:hypothetical protein CCACVL1_19518 [Corchorus capsularis]|uniref:Reverse transcriptase zinc-binding domain-containing protein n=1 Tax=Corchorus capsularis TaxID=210143 RepID=A0A1R3HGI6_COCAP|nr:hypothetical protein CCACVL1_19518 [Corchorus capsularis]